jgi:hypothetical protein
LNLAVQWSDLVARGYLRGFPSRSGGAIDLGITGSAPFVVAVSFEGTTNGAPLRYNHFAA